jgi:hypothetical protein
MLVFGVNLSRLTEPEGTGNIPAPDESGSRFRPFSQTRF